MTILNLDAFRKDTRLFSPYGPTSRIDLTSDDDWRPYLFPDCQDDYSSNRSWCRKIFRPACIPIILILSLIIIIILLPLRNWDSPTSPQVQESCADKCTFSLVESIPEGLVYPPGSPSFLSTHDVWIDLITKANATIEIGVFYFLLTNNGKPDNYTSAWKGYDVYNQLLEAGSKRNIKIKIAENTPSEGMPSVDAELLAEKAGAELRKLDFENLMGGGVLHTKLWIVDRKHFYIGSANMDWRSLTQVKELGAVVYNCPCLAKDISKIFDVYWELGRVGATIPDVWPDSLSTDINLKNPLNINFNGSSVKTFLASAPPPFNPRGRTSDVDAILNIISKAKRFVYISVMDYLPLLVFSRPIKFWPLIDSALRTAAIDKQVEVRLLISLWNHTRDYEIHFLRSLDDLDHSFKNTRVQVKLFKVPSTSEQSQIPFARVNHNKYMVTDKTGYIGTSNWSGDYFTNTAGIGFVIEKIGNSSAVIRDQLQSIFERDWNSPYAKNLEEFSQKSDNISLVNDKSEDSGIYYWY